MSVEVLNVAYASIQDLGRFGYRSLGVPVSGALDKLSAAYLNALVGNEPNTPLIEVVASPIRFRVLKEVIMAVGGAWVDIEACGESVDTWEPVWLEAGCVVDVSPPKRGFITYVAFSGGLVADYVMGSASTYYRGGFGGFKGRLLRRGDVLEVRRRDLRSTWESIESLEPPDWLRYRVPSKSACTILKATEGIHADLIRNDLRVILSSTYSVSPKSDRMGYRLVGPELSDVKSLGRLPSIATDRGYVQVLPSSELAVLMADAQTTGGYAVALHVLQPYVDILAQCGPYYRVRFSLVSSGEAESVTREYFRLLKKPEFTK